jgi:hypothetical protein
MPHAQYFDFAQYKCPRQLLETHSRSRFLSVVVGVVTERSRSAASRREVQPLVEKGSTNAQCPF